MACCPTQRSHPPPSPGMDALVGGTVQGELPSSSSGDWSGPSCLPPWSANCTLLAESAPVVRHEHEPGVRGRKYSAIKSGWRD